MDAFNDADELVCRELVELVTDYLEGALPAPERTRVERHLEACEDCRAYLGQLRRTIAALGRRGADGLTADEQERLLALFRSLRRAGHDGP